VLCLVWLVLVVAFNASVWVLRSICLLYGGMVLLIGGVGGFVLVCYCSRRVCFSGCVVFGVGGVCVLCGVVVFCLGSRLCFWFGGLVVFVWCVVCFVCVVVDAVLVVCGLLYSVWADWFCVFCS